MADRGAAVVVLEAADVVLAEVVAVLDLDDEQRLVVEVGDAVGHAEGDHDRLALVQHDGVLADLTGRDAGDDVPVLGAAFVGLEREPLAGLDLEGAAMTMQINGETKSTGVGAAALGNPLNAAAWLARTLAAAGDPLKKGDILLAGALGPMVALSPDEKVHAIIEGIGECSFVYGDAP